jgi:4-oxalmesaconate hydratase
MEAKLASVRSKKIEPNGEDLMIIDCHGHYTTAPEPHQAFREQQISLFNSGSLQQAEQPDISDDMIRESIENNQLKLLRDRGADMTIFSPRASAMAHHIGDNRVSQQWTRACNDLIHRVVTLYPDYFIGVCQLPQSPGIPIAQSIAELERCITELGFIGCNLNPDPSGGHWTSAHYINADTTAFMQFIEGDLFKDFPELRFIIPHGGGAVPYHWGRYRGLADMLKRPPLPEHVMKNVFFDTCVYHQPGIDLLFEVIDIDNILFGSEMVGAVRGIDPETGFYFDDTKRYIDALDIPAEDKRKVFELNARRVYPRLDATLKKRGL